MSIEQCTINPAAKIQLRYVGQDHTPVMLIDDFMLDTQPVIDYACEFGQFNLADTYYPGNRAKLARSYVIKVLQQVYPQLYQVYNIPSHLQLKPQATYYSLITHQPEQLALMQRMPHFDSVTPYYFAVLHYLNPAPHGDTGLFRHIPTGFEHISSQREETYFAEAKEYIMQNGEPPMRYCVGSEGQFELYDSIKYQANRLAIYPGHLLHSCLVQNELDIDPSPRTGRLTANIFIDFL